MEFAFHFASMLCLISGLVFNLFYTWYFELSSAVLVVCVLLLMPEAYLRISSVLENFEGIFLTDFDFWSLYPCLFLIPPKLFPLDILRNGIDFRVYMHVLFSPHLSYFNIIIFFFWDVGYCIRAGNLGWGALRKSRHQCSFSRILWNARLEVKCSMLISKPQGLLLP